MNHAPYQGTVHYLHDYAQQLHYPSDSPQPGPRKCAILGVCCEAIPRQVNNNIDFIFTILKKPL